MSGKKVIAILGATGHQGGSVVDTFLQDPLWTVRALTRSPNSSKAKTLGSRGAEVFEADLNDVASLKKAFAGAHVVFSVTDFWAIFADPATTSRLKPDQTLVHSTYEVELQHGKNVFDAAAMIPTLERLVYSTLANVKKISNGKYDKVYHYDSKAEAAEYGEKMYPELWAKTSLIQLGYYLSNLLTYPLLTPKKTSKPGVFAFSDPSPDNPFHFVAADEDTGILTKALVTASPGKNLVAFRGAMTTRDFARLWAKVLGVEAETVVMDYTGPMEFMKETFEQTFLWAQEYGMYDEKNERGVVLPKDLDLSLDLGTVEDWIRAQDWSSILQG